LIRQDLPERHLGLFASLALLGAIRIPVASQYFADLRSDCRFQLQKRRKKRIQEIIEISSQISYRDII
jgi:hypothetical protein